MLASAKKVQKAINQNNAPIPEKAEGINVLWTHIDRRVKRKTSQISPRVSANLKVDKRIGKPHQTGSDLAPPATPLSFAGRQETYL